MARRGKPRSATTHPRPQTAAKVPPSRRTADARATAGFPIVGIGTSAGGLEALEQFLRNVPADSGVAFIILQHLDPTHKGLLPELLQRATPMPVRQIKDRTRVQPDCVYVIPPNKDLSILQGVLHLLPLAVPRGVRLPIDFFFRALAADRREWSVGIILSGMGTDGTLGLRAIKEQAGLVFVQDPVSAKFDSMPRSAIEAGLADVVASPAEMPQKLLAALQRFPKAAKAKPPLEEATQSGLEKVLVLLRTQTGHDFTHYKKSTIYRRIERRMGLHQLGTIATYVRFLQTNPAELDLLFKELLIGVTSFFRDPAAWEALAKRGLPAMLAVERPGQTIRAWVPGCATGEEAYSLAMVFSEVMEIRKNGGPGGLQIFATDLDRDAIDRARLGLYPANIAADVSPERLRRFFYKDTRGYRVRPEIRGMVTFAPQNVLMEPPFTKLDFLSCRNLLIYLDSEVQRKLLPLFHYSLNPNGLLLLGSAETVGGFTNLFTPLDAKTRLYQRTTAVRIEPVEFPAAFVGGDHREAATDFRAGSAGVNIQAAAEQVLLQHYAPAAVLATPQGDILFVSGRTGKYLEPAAGKANWNILAMAREGLRGELPPALRHTVRKGGPVQLHHVEVKTDGGRQAVNVAVQALTEPPGLRGMVLFVFTDVAIAPPPVAPRRGSVGGQTQVVALEREIQEAREDARSTREEMQTAHEELRSANEELQSTNEELQSTNEELTTSKEELQSLNEELQTVNAELQAKVDELSKSSADLRNLLNNTDIATLFLDGALHVRRFTSQTTALIKLIPGDVGRPLTDLASDLLYPELAADAQEVLRMLVPIEKEVATQGGRWYQARILPYRTLEDKIDGVVITFMEITTNKRLEAELRDALAQSRDNPRA